MFYLGNSIYTLPTYIVPELNNSVILGHDFFEKYNCIIDFKSGSLKIGKDNLVPFNKMTTVPSQHEKQILVPKEKFELPFSDENFQSLEPIFLHSTDTFVIQPHTECIIPPGFRQHDLAETTAGLIQPNDRLQTRYGLIGAA